MIAAARRIAMWLVYATALSPLVFWPGTIYPYVVPRAVYFRVLIAVAAPVAIGVWAATRRRGAERRRTDPFGVALIVVLVVQLVTALLGEAPLRSLFGDLERMGGVVAWLHYAGLYFAITLMAGRREVATLLRITMCVALVVGAIAVLQAGGVRVGVLPGTDAVRAVGTLGNAGYLAIYCVLGIGVAALVGAGSTSRGWKAVAGAALGVDLVAVVLAASRAAMGGLAVGACAGLAVYTLASAGRSRRGAIVAGLATLAVLAAGAVALASRRATMPGARPGVTWLERGLGNRVGAWSAGLAAVAEAPAAGLGAENFRLAFDRHFDPTRFRQDFHFNKAHNSVVEWAVAAGLPGALAWLALWGAFAWAVVGARREGALTAAETAVLSGSALAYFAYLQLWFVEHNAFPVFIALAAFVAVRRRGSDPVPSDGGAEGPGRGLALVVGSLLALLAVADVMHEGRVLSTAHGLVVASTAPSLRTTIAAYGRALDGRPPGTEEAVGELVTFADVAPGRVGERLSEPAIRTIVLDLLERARAELAAQIACDSRNPRLYRDAGQLHVMRYQVGGDAAFADSAARSFGRAIELAPDRLRYRHMLSEAQLMRDDPAAAVRTLEAGLARYDRLGETYYYLAKARLIAGDNAGAAEALARAYDLGYVNPSGAVHDALARELRQGERRDLLERLNDARAGALATR